MRRLLPCLLLALLGLTGRAAPEEPLPDGLYAEFTTAHGAITAVLYADQVPMTVTHFVGLAEGTIAPRDGQPYYTGLRWYRVIPGFVIQSGNPDHPEESNPVSEFPDEFVPGLRHDAAGVLSMANAGPDTNSSSFFITLSDQTRLNYLHSVFGRVVRGAEFLPLIQPDEPFSLRIIRRGDAAHAFRADAAAFATLRAQAKPYPGLAEPGPMAACDDPDAILPVAPPWAATLNFKLANYERVTGLKIRLRLSAHEPPAAEDEIAGAYMQAWASRLGVAQTGVLIAYFADDDWRVWLGDEVVARFLGRPALPEDLVEGGALHEAKETLIDDALARGETLYADRLRTKPESPPGQRIKLQLDALLDALLLRLEPRT